MSIYTRDFSPPNSSYFLLGARGSGKSTFLSQTYPNAKTINLLSEKLYQSYLAQPDIFYQELCILEPSSTVVVDEIQRLPNLLNEVHRLIEEKKLRFVLSGSSARKLRREGVNLLAGRALMRSLHPLTPNELASDFHLEKVLEIGSLPLIWSSVSPAETLKSYIQTYLKEEIQAEAIVRNLSGFARFLPIAALFHGQRINTSSLARDAEVPRSTVEGFFSILEDTLMGFRLPAFETRLRVREKKRAKFYFIDPGIARALKKNYGALSTEERGHLFEGWVAELLRTYKDYHELFDEMFYWSPAEANKTEVDFVLQRGQKFLALECKSSTHVSATDLKGLKAIKDLKGLEKRVLLYTGNTKRETDGILILPINDFLAKLSRGDFW